MYAQSNLLALTNESGLVRMRFVADRTPYYEGSMAGFPPDVAANLMSDGDAFPCDDAGRPIQVAVDAPSAPQLIETRTIVAIPPDWESSHHLARIRLAKAIRGGDQPVVTAQEADDIIRTEVQRRERP